MVPNFFKGIWVPENWFQRPRLKKQREGALWYLAEPKKFFIKATREIPEGFGGG